MFFPSARFVSVALVTPSLLGWPASVGIAQTQPAPGQAVAPARSCGPAAAIKTVWAKGLHAPQGMARDGAGNVYVAEYRGGQIAKFAPDGTPLGKIGEGLKSPAWIERAGDYLYVSERKANRLLRMGADGKLRPVEGTVEEPLGLAADASGRLIVVSHTTSRLFALPRVGQKLVPLYAPPAQKGKRYGYRCVAVDRDGTLFFTDEADGQLMLLTPGGRAATWVRGLDDPTTVVISPRGEVFVAEEGAGRIARIDAHGASSIVAEGLGKPRDIEFLDERTLLVSDQEGGVIWKVTLPPPAAPKPAAP